MTAAGKNKGGVRARSCEGHPAFTHNFKRVAILPKSQRSSSTIVVSANSSWNIVNFRAGLIRGLIARGHRVTVIAPPDEHSGRIESLGAAYRPIELSSSGLSPLQDMRSLVAYYRLLNEIRPQAYLAFTSKPNIYGALAAQRLGIRVLNNISGLGVAFSEPGVLQTLVSALYRAALRRSDVVFFQNPDDRQLFLDRALVGIGQARLVSGSGVDLERFQPTDAPRPEGPFRFLLVARMLWDKGVGQYIEAARMLRSEGREASFSLLGHAGVDNRSAIGLDQLEQWQAEGVANYLGASDDVRPHLSRADCVVLPSYYREGIPRSLIEAAAMGRPIITTNEVGCREAVDDGVSGFLCTARSAGSLAEAMRRMMDLDPGQRAAMGKAGRAKAVRQFDERSIAQAYSTELDR